MEKRLINKDVFKVIGWHVYQVRLFRETKDFYVFLKPHMGEVRQQKQGCHIFYTLSEAVAFAEKNLTEKVEKARENLVYLCQQKVECH